MRSGVLVRAVVGAAISIIALWLVLSGVDLGRTVELLGRADLWWVALAAVLVTGTLVTADRP